MRLRTLMLLVLLALSEVAFAQKSDLRIDGISYAAGAVPGQMVTVFVAGLSEQPGPPIPLDRFQVAVTQDGVAHQAKVRSVALGFMNPRVPTTPPSSPPEKFPDLNEQLSGMQPYQSVMFTVPPGLHEGDAAVAVSYRGRRSNEFTLKITSQLPKPRIAYTLAVATMVSRPAPIDPADLKNKTPTLRLERGRNNALSISPLIDPEAPDAGVLVTFKQGSLIREVSAKVIRRDGTEHQGTTIIFAPIRYEVSVPTPDELQLGAAQIEVRLKLNGQISEPEFADVLITDSSGDAGGASAYRPRPTILGEQKIGFGQALQVSIDAKWLDPDPSKTLIVLEQGSKRFEVKPEFNTATHRARLSELAPAVLFVRLQEDLLGKASLRVHNPARGERDGLSESVPIEIVEEVVPPLAIKVGEAEKQDITMLRALRDARLKQGRDFPEYDPQARYVTIQAIGLDYNPNYIRVKFEQGGRQFTLKYEDFSLTMGERLVVRVPDAIQPGSIKLTVQNKGKGRWSDPVIATVEITQPSKRDAK